MGKHKRRGHVNLHRKRRLDHHHIRVESQRIPPSYHEESGNGHGIIIFKSELDYISRCILDYKHIETGGQLFGYWAEDGTPVVLYAIGPGPRANHQTTFFNQDVDYLVKVGRALKSKYGLHHIGEWHSHHQLGLARPSSHDANTMISTIREKKLGRFVLCIGNCNELQSTLNPFLCDEVKVSSCRWNVIMTNSHMRNISDRELDDILVHPMTLQANYCDDRLNDRESTMPLYAAGYWLNEKQNRISLKGIMDYLQLRHRGAAVKAALNDRGEVIVSVTDIPLVQETIRFPLGFPNNPPEINRISFGRNLGILSRRYWEYRNMDIVSSFKSFYELI